MGNNKDTELGNKPWIVIIGLVASIIVIITFLSGRHSVGELVANDAPIEIGVITDAVHLPTAEAQEDGYQPVEIVVTQESPSSNSSVASDSSSIGSPGEIIRGYYSFIDSGNYQGAWSMLSDHFKNTYNDSGYQPYVDWWSTVREVEILSVQTESQDSYSAELSVELKYYYQNGQIDTYDLMNFTLMFDSGINDWLIDDGYLVKGAR